MTDVSFVFTVALGASFALVFGLVAVAQRRGLLDVPNERSSHTRPTPRGGGLGLVLALVGVLLFTPSAGFGRSETLLALGGVLAVSLIGWLDDQRGGVAPRVRLVVHLVCGLAFLPLATDLPTGALPLAVTLVWWVFWTVAAINVVNFMDGIDGLIGSQAMLFGVHLALNGGLGAAHAFGVALAGASAGFLLLNWSPARIFLGDVGSGALGALFVLGGILAMRDASLSLFTAFLPLGPIFLDATATLIARAARGEKLSEAHRSHVYQRLANGGMGHAPVSSLFALAAAVGILLVRTVPVGIGSASLYLAACAGAGALLMRRVTARGAT
jgi:Fuc2NAc and GlcNAc transferase